MFAKLCSHVRHNAVGYVAIFLAVGGGGAFAATRLVGSDGRLYACVDSTSGGLRVVKKGKKCRKSEVAVSWGQEGPRGVQGVQGGPGVQGVQGEPGRDGTPGRDLTVNSTLPSGQTESGIFGATANVNDGYGSAVVQFRPPLASGLVNANLHYVPMGGSDPSCPGLGQAARGHLCLYAVVNSGMPFLGFYNPGSPSGSGVGNDADASGVVAFFTDVGGIQKHVRGRWSVTAP